MYYFTFVSFASCSLARLRQALLRHNNSIYYLWYESKGLKTLAAELLH